MCSYNNSQAVLEENAEDVETRPDSPEELLLAWLGTGYEDASLQLMSSSTAGRIVPLFCFDLRIAGTGLPGADIRKIHVNTELSQIM